MQNQVTNTKTAIKNQWLIATIIGILIPLSYVFYLISNAGEISSFDYWWIIKKFYSMDGFSFNPGDWFFNNNEHLVFVPSVIYAINIVLTKGSNIGLCVAAVILATTYLILLIKMLPPTLKQKPLLYFCLVLWLALCCFTPAAAHNWMRGFSGVIWMSANLFVISAIFCLHKLAKDIDHYQLLKSQNNPEQAPPKLSLKWLIASIGFAIGGYLSYSTALAVWPVLCSIALIRRWPKVVTWSYVGGMALIYGIFLLNYQTPEHHPGLSLNFVDVIQYILIYLGAIFSYEIPIAMTFAGIGIIATIALVLYWLSPKGREIRTEWLPWLAVQGYIIGTAVLASLSRSGNAEEGYALFGIGQARSSRYASLPGLFWASLITLTILFILHWIKKRKRQRIFFLPLIVVCTLLTIAMFATSAIADDDIFFRAKYQPLVRLASQLGIKDEELIKERIANRPAAFLEFQEILKAHGLVPFNWDIKPNNFCIPLSDQKIEKSQLIEKPQESLKGYFDTFTNFDDKAGRAQGWVGDPDNKIKCLVILNQEQKVRGFGMAGFIRDDVAKLFGEKYQLSGWKGYFDILPGDQSFQAYVMFKDSDKWVTLRNVQKIKENKK